MVAILCGVGVGQVEEHSLTVVDEMLVRILVPVS
jgi:hypothetical protein